MQVVAVLFVQNVLDNRVLCVVIDVEEVDDVVEVFSEEVHLRAAREGVVVEAVAVVDY